MVLNKEQESVIVEILQNTIKDLKAVYIFGSYADGSANNESDIDIAFLSFEKFTSLERWDILNEIGNSLNKDIDLIDLKEANSFLQMEVITKGKRLFSTGDEVELFEASAITLYLEFIDTTKEIREKIKKTHKILGA